MKNKLFLFLSFGALLCSCGSSQQASYAYSSTYNPPYTPPSTTSSSSRPATTSSSSSSSAYSPTTPTAKDVAALRDYLSSHGVWIDGSYAISNTTVLDDETTVFDAIYYHINTQQFSTLTNLTVTVAGVGEVRNLGGVTFDLTSFSSATVVGSTKYVVTSGSTRTNSFVLYPVYNAYPSFNITRYMSSKTENSKTVSTDAELCANCATRAINNLIKSLPSMGVYAKLW